MSQIPRLFFFGLSNTEYPVGTRRCARCGGLSPHDRESLSSQNVKLGRHMARLTIKEVTGNFEAKDGQICIIKLSFWQWNGE